MHTRILSPGVPACRAVGHARARGLTLLAMTLLTGAALVGCDSTGTSGGGILQADDGRERWTLRAFHSDKAGHAEQATTLAELLRSVEGLDARKVRLVTDAKSSAIYYGEYTKVGSSETDRLVFPPDYQRDFNLIRRLTLGQTTPFAYAQPEVVQRKAAARGEFDIANAKGTYTLQIAVFYNTPQFTQREEGARQYVQALRQQGYSAYYLHEPLKSFVYVGDFDASDVAGGQWGPRVEQFIKQNEAEFRHMSENGQLVSRVGLDGASRVPFSVLVPVPKQ